MACAVSRKFFLFKRIKNIQEHFMLVSSYCANSTIYQTTNTAPLFYNNKVQFVYPSKTNVFCKHLTISSSNLSKNDKEKNDAKKPSLFQRFKQMYRDYWYVLVPVHLVTSAAWFGSFYYMAKSGVDIVALLETWHVSEKIINPLKDSSMGYIALAYAMYKVATPLRYTVTLGGTTISINYLKKWGYIKPVPSTERMKEIYLEKKENLMETFQERKEEMKETKDQIIKTVSKGTEKLKKQKMNIKQKMNDVKEKT